MIEIRMVSAAVIVACILALPWAYGSCLMDTIAAGLSVMFILTLIDRPQAEDE